MKPQTKKLLKRFDNYRKAYGSEFLHILETPLRGSEHRQQIAGMWRITKERYGRKGIKSFLATYHK